jgi:hypothetical protein
MEFRNPSYGIMSLLHLAYRTPYTRYIEPHTHGILTPTHGISNSLSMVYRTPSYGIMKPIF